MGATSSTPAVASPEPSQMGRSRPVDSSSMAPTRTDERRKTVTHEGCRTGATTSFADLPPVTIRIFVRKQGYAAAAMGHNIALQCTRFALHLAPTVRGEERSSRGVSATPSDDNAIGDAKQQHRGAGCEARESRRSSRTPPRWGIAEATCDAGSLAVLGAVRGGDDASAKLAALTTSFTGGGDVNGEKGAMEAPPVHPLREWENAQILGQVRAAPMLSTDVFPVASFVARRETEDRLYGTFAIKGRSADVECTRQHVVGGATSTTAGAGDERPTTVGPDGPCPSSSPPMLWLRYTCPLRTDAFGVQDASVFAGALRTQPVVHCVVEIAESYLQ